MKGDGVKLMSGKISSFQFLIGSMKGHFRKLAGKPALSFNSL